MAFGIVIFPGVEELDFVGPWEMMGLWNRLGDGPADRLLIAQSLAAVVCAKGLSVIPHVTFDSCPPLRYLLVPGGQGTRGQVSNPALLGFLSRQAPGCKALLSVCTGSFLLHAAGLLSGRRATTHWASLARLRGLGDVEVVEQRFVRDGPVWTSAGITAGMDMMLAFIAGEAGEAAAATVQARAEYYPSAVRYGDFHERPEAPAYLKDR